MSSKTGVREESAFERLWFSVPTDNAFTAEDSAVYLVDLTNYGREVKTRSRS